MKVTGFPRTGRQLSFSLIILNGLKGVKSGQTVLEQETKHSTVLERFWNRKKEYLRVLEKKTHIFDQIFTSLYDC